MRLKYAVYSGAIESIVPVEYFHLRDTYRIPCEGVWGVVEVEVVEPYQLNLSC